jgi:hypothetical protein
MQTEADFWPLNYADFGARKDGRKEEQKDAKTGTTEIWPAGADGVSPEPLWRVMKTVPNP